MTAAKTTGYRSKPLDRAANEIYLAIVKASDAGYRLVVKGGWALDLVDPETGESTPLWGLTDDEE